MSRPKTIGYFVTDDRNNSMEWVSDQNNYGFYYTSAATMFKTRAQARRHIANNLKAEPRNFTYKIKRLAELSK